MVAVSIVSCSECMGKSTTTSEVSKLDTKFDGVWQLCYLSGVNTEGVNSYSAVPAFKIYNTDAGTFENIRLLPNGQLARITSGGKVSDVKSSTYVEKLSESVYSDVPIGTAVTITYEFVNDNMLKLRFTLANATKVNEEIWMRVK